MSRPRRTRTDTQPASVRRVGVARALSKWGVASRTVAAAWVRGGRVSLNGRPVRDPEQPVVIGRDELRIDGVAVQPREKCYLMLNKPRGLVTTRHDEQGRDTVYSCLPAGLSTWLAPVGRLDKASEGLLLFTNDNLWANRLLDPASHLPKVYHVQIDRLADETLLARLRGEVQTADGETLRASEVRLLRQAEKTSWLEITLHEGRNRHIRRLCEALGLDVRRLVRVAIGPLTLGTLAKGETRALTPAELREIDDRLARSSRNAGDG